MRARATVVFPLPLVGAAMRNAVFILLRKITKIRANGKEKGWKS
jgi:hypothetical protein